MPTPHIAAEVGDFAECVLLPGDPLRAKHIADTFLGDAKQVTGVRNMLGFTGTYQGMAVSVMGTGMGIPSASIYATELITEYGCQRLVRVGSAGGISSEVKLRDVVVATGACTDSAVNRARYHNWDYSAVADFYLARASVAAAEQLETEVKVGNVHSADLFYNPVPEVWDVLERMNVLAVEMEAAGLYGVAAEKGARALAILTISDHIRTGEATTSLEREQTFNSMVEIALQGLLLDQTAA
ncbi:MAG: purine-nucleoside phosphorylase [Actinobacteria bacterium]|nr:purine-nucleoside phosphorylase [Acidimicrobiia bacterium]MCA1734867.1 purine-nucleoside phosphorylase [Actinomycetota bacterium]MDQ3500624.1 purine-nucleoside phosphorylase [Actinomycetota bacterium]